MVDKRVIIAILFTILLLAVLPLTYPGYPWNQNQRNTILVSASETAHALSDHQFPIRWFANVNRGTGSALPVYESPFVYCIATVFSLMGLDVIASVEWTAGLLIILGTIGMYLAVATWLTPYAGLAAASLYLFQPFRVGQLHLFGDLSGFAASSFFPWIIYFGLKLHSRPMITIPGFIFTTSLMIYSDLTGVFGIFSALLLISILRHTPRIQYYHLKLFALILASLLLTASYWFPALFEATYINAVQSSENPVETESASDHLVYPHQWFQHSWGDGNTRPGPDDRAPFQLGLPVVILFIFSITNWIPNKKIVKTNRLLGLTTLVFFVLLSPAASRLWQIDFLEILRYPWRLMWIPPALLVFAAASVIQMVDFSEQSPRISSNYKFLLTIIIVCAAVYIGGGFYTPSPYRFTDSKQYSGENIRQMKPDYRLNFFQLKRSHTDDPPPYRLTVVDGESTVTAYNTDRGHHLNFDVSASEPSEFATNIAFFPGWTLRIDHEKMNQNIEMQSHFIRFFVPKGVHNIDLRKGATIYQSIGDIVSITTLIVLLLMLTFTLGMNRVNPQK